MADRPALSPLRGEGEKSVVAGSIKMPVLRTLWRASLARGSLPTKINHFERGERGKQRVANGDGFCHDERVSTLAEVEQAAAKLAPEDQKQLLRFLLRILPMDESELPEPRIF